MMMRSFRFHVALALMLVLLTGTLLPTRIALADSPVLSELQAVKLLQAYTIVRGDPSKSLNLDQKLTRAQAAAIFVRSMGADELAKTLAAEVSFSDSVGHWAAGDIAMVERLGLMKGDGDGHFRPESDITYVEVLTVLLRMVKQEPSGPWQPSSIVAEAARLSIVPPGVQPTATAIRGKVFWALASAITQVPLPTGETVLQKHVDHTPPVLTLDRTSLTTTERVAVVAGTADGAVKVMVAGKPATFTEATGRFTATIDLAYGKNQINVEGIDYAGNEARVQFTAERRGTITRLDIEGPTKFNVSTTNKLTVSAVDSQGKPLPFEGLEADVSNDLATFDPGKTTLTTGSKVGKGVLTLQVGSIRKTFAFEVTQMQLSFASINAGRSPTIDKDAIIKVQVLDADKKLITDDNARTISLTTSGLTDVTISSRTATTVAGVATFTIKGGREGTAVLSAKSAGIPDMTEIVQVLKPTRVVLTANPTTLQPDATSVSTIRATLQNEAGQTITNRSGSDIEINLSTSGTDGVLTDQTLFIPNGASSSSSNAYFQAGIHPGTVRINGTIGSNQDYSVQSLSLPVAGELSGTKLQLVYPTTKQNPNGQPIPITLKVLDDKNRLVTAGSYAFQMTVVASNGEVVTGGMPEGVSLTFPSTLYRPVDDGRVAVDPLNDASSVVGRTHQGIATLELRYNKSGIVTLTPKLVGPTEEAYHPTTGFGPASGSSDMSSDSARVTFVGTAVGTKLTVDSTLGKDQAGGAFLAYRSGSMILRAQVVDANGAPLPGYNGEITLTRANTGDKVSAISGSSRKAATNGVAEFTIQSSGTPGFDLYTASSSAGTSPTVAIAVRDQKASVPEIAAIRGVKIDRLSPVTGYVGPEDEFMDIQLRSQEPPDSAEPHYWASAKVFRKGESSPLFTSGIIDLKSDLPVIRIPKASLKPGRFTYEVVVNNGAGESQRSLGNENLSQAVNSVYSSVYAVSSALYDAETGKLTLTTKGLTSGGTIATDKLTLVKENHSLNLGDASVTSVSSSSVVLLLGDLTNQIDPDIFFGNVVIQAESGWFITSDGTQVARGNNNVQVQPMSVITHAALDQANKRLFLYGSGLAQGTISLDLISVQQGDQVVALRPGTSTTSDRLATPTDSLLTINLSQATLEKLLALQGPTITLTAKTGWLKVASGSTVHRAHSLEGANRLLYVRTSVNSVVYDPLTKQLTIHGSGFSDSTLHLEKLLFRASGKTTTWSPSGGSAVIAGDDQQMVIQLSASSATDFASKFNGQRVFLNTVPAWLVDAQGRLAEPIPVDSVLFRVQIN